jgi:A/G-specific adenine glycosylase
MDPHPGLMRQPAILRRKLLAWYDASHRDLPWRRTEDPYRIWLSEIMLQQTRAQAVIPYYHKFLDRFPTVEALAAASVDEVLACWSGLGYYSRARNLRLAARQIALAGDFPREHASLLELAGVGEYTAAAVGSIAFGLPHAVLDGNVRRVLARLLNEAGEISSAPVRLRLKTVAHELLDRKHPGRFNQAMMELGATVCVPGTPKCSACPLAGLCEGFRQGTASELPVKLRAKNPVEIAGTLVIVVRGEGVLLWKRPRGAGRMAEFWELPEPAQLPGLRLGEQLGTVRHAITHHRYTFRVIAGKIPGLPEGLSMVARSRLAEMPLSTMARKALRFCPGIAKVL